MPAYYYNNYAYPHQDIVDYNWRYVQPPALSTTYDDWESYSAKPLPAHRSRDYYTQGNTYDVADENRNDYQYNQRETYNYESPKERSVRPSDPPQSQYQDTRTTLSNSVPLSAEILPNLQALIELVDNVRRNTPETAQEHDPTVWRIPGRGPPHVLEVPNRREGEILYQQLIRKRANGNDTKNLAIQIVVAPRKKVKPAPMRIPKRQTNEQNVEVGATSKRSTNQLYAKKQNSQADALLSRPSPGDDIAIKPAHPSLYSNTVVDEPPEVDEENEDSAPCPHCNKRFDVSRIGEHVALCGDQNNNFQSKFRPSGSTSMSFGGGGPSSARIQAKPEAPLVLGEPDSEGRYQCPVPVCQRRFAEDAARRHFPICQRNYQKRKMNFKQNH